MNIQTFLVAALLLGLFFLVLYKSLRRMKRGGGCSSCGHSSGCSLYTSAEKKPTSCPSDSIENRSPQQSGESDDRSD